MSRRLAVLVCGVVAAIVAVPIGARGAGAGNGGAGPRLLHRARHAATHNEYQGTVAIQWRDAGGRHRRIVSVEMNGGLLHVDDDRLVSAGTRRVMRTDEGWQLLWAGGWKGSEPDPTLKYRFLVTRPASVAHRGATRVAVRRPGARRAIELLFFDDATGMLLRRDQLDAHGRMLRRFAFVKLSTTSPVGTSPTRDLPRIDPASRANAPRALEGVPDDLVGPKRIGTGFVLSGVYSQPDGTVQLYYSDGLLGLSVFEHEGRLAWDALPAGGRTIELRDDRARVYATAAGAAVVWGHDDVTYTFVTDAPLEDVTAIAASFSRSGDSGVVSEIGRFVTKPFSWG
jgi:MucB/RseB N-terminal domain